MSPYQQSVVAERDELGEKIELLKRFFDTERLEYWDRLLVLRQLVVMRDYHDLLEQRIAVFMADSDLRRIRRSGP